VRRKKPPSTGLSRRRLDTAAVASARQAHVSLLRWKAASCASGWTCEALALGRGKSEALRFSGSCTTTASLKKTSPRIHIPRPCVESPVSQTSRPPGKAPCPSGSSMKESLASRRKLTPPSCSSRGFTSAAMSHAHSRTPCCKAQLSWRRGPNIAAETCMKSWGGITIRDVPVSSAAKTSLSK